MPQQAKFVAHKVDLTLPPKAAQLSGQCTAVSTEIICQALPVQRNAKARRTGSEGLLLQVGQEFIPQGALG